MVIMNMHLIFTHTVTYIHTYTYGLVGIVDVVGIQ